MSAYNYLKIFIEYPCPRCKANIPCAEADRLIQCHSCQSIWITPNRDPAYYIQAKTRETDQLVYIPYWHHRGYYFVIKNQSIEYYWIDQTIAALSDPDIPFSLHQSILKERLLPFAGNPQGRFLQPQIPGDGCLNKGIHMLDGADLISKTIYEAPSSFESKKKSLLSVSWKELTGKEEKHQARKYKETDLISQLAAMNFHQLTSSEVYSKNNPSQKWIPIFRSLIFFPFIQRDGNFFNGLTQQRMKSPSDILKKQEYQQSQQLKLKQAQCPSCGKPLQLLEKSELLFCSSCKKIWIVYGDRLAPCGVGMMQSEVKESIYLPFWKLSVQGKGVDRYKNQEKTWCFNLDRDSDQTGFISLWIPAFELPSAHLIRVASFLSRIDLDLPLVRISQKIEKTKNNISLNNAVQIASVLIMDMARKDGSFYATLADFQLSPQKALFIYLPFSRKGMDLIQPETNLCIQAPPFLYQENEPE